MCPFIFSPMIIHRKHRFCHRRFNFSINLNLIHNFQILSSSSAKTRNQFENRSKEELTEELVTVDDISSKLSDLSNRFDNFLRRFEVVPSNLDITRNCNRLLTKRVVQLEKNAVTNAPYHLRELVKVNPSLHQLVMKSSN